MKSFSFWKIAFFLPIALFFILGSIVFANQLWKMPKSVIATNDSGGQDMSLLDTNPPSVGCYYAGGTYYSNWDHSQKYKDNSPWNVDFTVNSENGAYSRDYFQDVNGDGLSDYIYYYNYLGLKECVYLNNGSGWDLIYRCVGVRNSSGVWTYYGDCTG